MEFLTTLGPSFLLLASFGKFLPQNVKLACAPKGVCVLEYCGVQNYSVSSFILFEKFTVLFFQDWAGWGIFTVILGNPRRTKGDSQHLEARPELQDWLRSELFTVKNYRAGPFSK